VRRVFFALGVACIVAAAASPSAQAPRWFDLDVIDRAVAAYRTSSSVPGIAIAVTRGADLIHTAGFGRDGNGRAITSQTRLPIASLSKSFTSMAVMQLVEAVAFHKLDQRLAALLLGKGKVIHMTHQHLADELGSVREIVSRLLKTFAGQGLVSLGREEIEIVNPQALRRISEGA